MNISVKCPFHSLVEENCRNGHFIETLIHRTKRRCIHIISPIFFGLTPSISSILSLCFLSLVSLLNFLENFSLSLSLHLFLLICLLLYRNVSGYYYISNQPSYLSPQWFNISTKQLKRFIGHLLHRWFYSIPLTKCTWNFWLLRLIKLDAMQYMEQKQAILGGKSLAKKQSWPKAINKY